MMTELLKHVDELITHIKNLDSEIDDRMNPEQKEAAERISQMPGFGDVSAKAVISVIGTDMSRFPTDSHIASWSGLCRVIMSLHINIKVERRGKVIF